MIDAENLTKKFGSLTAVEDLTLHVDEVFGFLGPNGAGKTTTVRMLCCLISKTSGKAKISDYVIGNSADQQKMRNQQYRFILPWIPRDIKQRFRREEKASHENRTNNLLF